MPEPCESICRQTAANDAAELEKCIKSLAEGDTDAMGPLYELTKTSVYAYSLSLLKNSSEAEDAMHDCYIRINSSANRYKPDGKPMAWIMTVAKNICLSRLRELKKRAELTEEDWHSMLRTDDIQTNLHVAEMLEMLSDTERQIVLMHTIAGFKHREIAKHMKLPLATVITKHTRALKKLRKYYREGEGA